MNLFRRPDYDSDATQFLNELKRNNPKLPAQQAAGRALLWEPALPDAAEQQALEAGFKEAEGPYALSGSDASVFVQSPCALASSTASDA